MAHQVIEKTALSADSDETPVLLGIPTRGTSLAVRLTARIAEFSGVTLPTGALDITTGRELLEVVRKLVSNPAAGSGKADDLEGNEPTTIVMVTHDPNVASYADRVVFLADGALVGELTSPTADAVAARMTDLAVA